MFVETSIHTIPERAQCRSVATQYKVEEAVRLCTNLLHIRPELILFRVRKVAQVVWEIASASVSFALVTDSIP